MRNTAVGFLLFFPFTLASFIVDTLHSTATTCEPVLLQWQGGLPHGRWVVSVDGSLSESLGTFPVTSFHWNVDFEAGTVVTAQVTDSTGTTVESKPFTIQPGSNECTLKTTKIILQPEAVNASTESQTSPPSSSSSSTLPDDPPRTTSKPKPSTTLSSTGSRTVPAAPTNTAATSSSSSPHSTASAANPTTPSTISDSPATPSLSELPALSPSSPASGSTTPHKPRVGVVFAVLVPILVLFVVLGLVLARRRRRRREALSALEAQPLPSHWFNRPAYRRSKSELPVLDIRSLNTVGILPDAKRKVPASEAGSRSTPSASTSSSKRTSATDTDLTATLETRITSLIATNGLLASLARAPGNNPPPAYASSEG
ncbi:hypothetical protein B0H13DRAFT_2274103 [Mycena leptocephala]|nr:hypothetical protein B0H13DRAFT_2274103 [Mycena leptocephala]